MRAKMYIPRTGYHSQDYQFRDTYLTEEFKDALVGDDKLFLYDRMTS